jgi:long-chain acyl-CoA synthetase
VNLREGVAATAADLIQHCRNHLAHYKCPREIDIRDEPMPLSGANKILKSILKAELGGDIT